LAVKGDHEFCFGHYRPREWIFPREHATRESCLRILRLIEMPTGDPRPDLAFVVQRTRCFPHDRAEVGSRFDEPSQSTSGRRRHVRPSVRRRKPALERIYRQP
jgi:hypothetical protein